MLMKKIKYPSETNKGFEKKRKRIYGKKKFGYLQMIF